MFTLQLLTICFGTGAVFLSFFLAYTFWRPGHTGLSRAMVIMLAAEGLMGLVTVIFAISAITSYGTLPPAVGMIARWVVFTAAATSSVHLSLKVRQVLKEDDK